MASGSSMRAIFSNSRISFIKISYPRVAQRHNLSDAEASLWLSDLHVLDKTTFYQVDVLDHALRNDIPFQVADHLMNFNDRTPHLIGVEADRFDVRINRRPLSRPVFADALTPIHTPAFPTVRPINIRAQRSQNSVNVAGIERAVDSREQIVVCRHRASLLSYFERFIDFN